MAHPDRMDAGLGLNYIKGISSYIDLNAALYGSFPDSISNNKTSGKDKHLLLETELSLRARLFNKKSFINPFLQAGAGLFRYEHSTGVYGFAGPGLELNYKDVFFVLSAQYRYSLFNDLNNHFFYSISIAGLLSRPKKKKLISPAIPQKPMALDRDGDGILDSLDACPLTPGIIAFQGCPDTDGDGIQDKEDQCPLVFGYKAYHGCPIPDRDGDDVNDEMDSCINVTGPKENKGCPLKNNIKEDLRVAAQKIFFKTGSYEVYLRVTTS